MKLCECIEKLTCLVTDHPELDDKDIVIVDDEGHEVVIDGVDYFDGEDGDGATSYLIISGKVSNLATSQS